MNFSELEKIMSSLGINSLADIARVLDTTPQAVSNWKSRNQVPFHVIAKVKDPKFQATLENLQGEEGVSPGQQPINPGPVVY